MLITNTASYLNVIVEADRMIKAGERILTVIPYANEVGNEPLKGIKRIMELRKRIWGVLAGVALGDAMGMPTECWSQEKIKKVFPNGIHQLYPADENDTFGRSLKAGAITDETILNTLMILKMLKKNQGRVQVEDYIKELVEWNKHQVFRHMCLVHPP